jgi:hypothetical protein
VANIKPLQNRNPYIIVLIDGDGLLVSHCVATGVLDLTEHSLQKT